MSPDEVTLWTILRWKCPKCGAECETAAGDGPRAPGGLIDCDVCAETFVIGGIA